MNDHFSGTHITSFGLTIGKSFITKFAFKSLLLKRNRPFLHSQDSTSTLTPTSSSNPYSSDEWVLSTPNNSPTSDGSSQTESNQLDAGNLTAALQRAITDISRFNQVHPYPPPSRPTRTLRYTGSYNYNRRRRPPQETGKEIAKR